MDLVENEKTNRELEFTKRNENKKKISIREVNEKQFQYHNENLQKKIIKMIC